MSEEKIKEQIKGELIKKSINLSREDINSVVNSLDKETIKLVCSTEPAWSKNLWRVGKIGILVAVIGGIITLVVVLALIIMNFAGSLGGLFPI